MKSRRDIEVEQAVLEAGPGLRRDQPWDRSHGDDCSDVLKCCCADAEQLGHEPSVLFRWAHMLDDGNQSG
jgi:hypothetical protein